MYDLLEDGFSKFKKNIRSLTFSRIKGRFQGPIVLANSIPKSGTHLLLNCLYYFPILRPANRHSAIRKYRHIGSAEVLNTIEKTKRGQYSSGHVPHNKKNAQILKKYDIKSLLIIRDPRDVIISHMIWVTKKHPNHRLRKHYKSLNKREKILSSLHGLSGKNTQDGKPFEGAKKWLDMFIPWTKESFNYTLKFEDLIGPKGGGERKSQKKTIKEIGTHLGVNLSDKEITHIAKNTYSPSSSTFRKGKIGDWKNHLDENLKNEIKENIGDWIIKLGYEENYEW